MPELTNDPLADLPSSVAHRDARRAPQTLCHRRRGVGARPHRSREWVTRHSSFNPPSESPRGYGANRAGSLAQRSAPLRPIRGVDEAATVTNEKEEESAWKTKCRTGSADNLNPTSERRKLRRRQRVASRAGFKKDRDLEGALRRACIISLRPSRQWIAFREIIEDNTIQAIAARMACTTARGKFGARERVDHVLDPG